MDDPYSSVESMLCWQIERARKQAEELREALTKAGELYPLPKPTDGLPEQWAFGKFTHQQVALAQAKERLKWVIHEIEKAETALVNGNLPMSIYWVVTANNSILSTSGNWASSGAVRMYCYVGKIRQSKSPGGKNRWKTKPMPSKEKLLADRENFYADNGHYQGWLKQAERGYNLSAKTINSIIGECDD